MTSRELRKQEHRIQIHLQHVSPILHLVFGRRRAAQESGVVYEDIDRTQLANGDIDELLTGACNGKIGYRGDGLHARDPSSGADLFEPLGFRPVNHDVRSGFRQAQGDSLP